VRRGSTGGLPPQALAVYGGLAVAAALLVWLLFFVLPGRFAEEPVASMAGAAENAPAVASPASGDVTAEDSRKITARIFYVSEGGGSLVGLERDVPLADDPAEQARAIVRAQTAAAEAPLVSAIPAGTTLRALYLTARGEAYVDLSREVAEAHPGGSVAELLTVYSIVHALTANLPAITSVQILVDGREVDTLAGHVNLRRPLAANPDWVQ
jgi:hypothetical protein